MNLSTDEIDAIKQFASKLGAIWEEDSIAREIMTKLGCGSVAEREAFVIGLSAGTLSLVKILEKVSERERSE